MWPYLRTACTETLVNPQIKIQFLFSIGVQSALLVITDPQEFIQSNNLEILGEKNIPTHYNAKTKKTGSQYKILCTTNSKGRINKWEVGRDIGSDIKVSQIRPITLLSVIGKIFEKIITKR